VIVTIAESCRADAASFVTSRR